ncbi:cell division protein FtsA [Shouchella lonarensis]|uniref:Cell division protein FtsA n=1 Tax=Shouchella lonarensis TaxID=1464122 RepID=A0A1G6KY15_9BACI|nr:cell division protein FtsA [Shouchella lonarensis]SDC35266.1 cell division protein FtsA [Shouchella lonarensis]
MSSETYVSLDIGTSSVRVIIAELTNGSMNILGVGNAPSKGVRKGVIVDIDETVQSIRCAIDEAERMVGVKIQQVVVGVNGSHVELTPCHGVVAVSSSDREIGHEDVQRVLEAAQVLSIPPEREIIDVLPKQFIVDGLDEITDPRGMIGVRLEVEGTMVTGSKTVLHNLLRCVERAGLEVADICLQSLATGAVAVSKDEKRLGVCVLDIGGGSTTISVFEQGTLQATMVLPVGGDHITNDLAIGLRMTTEEAERVKCQHGHAFIDEAAREEIVTIEQVGDDEKQTVTQLELARVIEPRLEELFELVAKELVRLGFKHFPSGFVLTGGTVSLPGVLELAKDMLNGTVRTAIPNYIGVREPTYTVSIGLIQFSHKYMHMKGREVAAAFAQVTEDTPRGTTASKQPSGKQAQQKNESKVKKMFKSLFE